MATKKRPTKKKKHLKHNQIEKIWEDMDNSLPNIYKLAIDHGIDPSVADDLAEAYRDKCIPKTEEIFQQVIEGYLTKLLHVESQISRAVKKLETINKWISATMKLVK